jgi:transposase
MIPTLLQLNKFDTRQSIMNHFDVSEKTVIRWLKFYGIYEKRENFGRKLNQKDAKNIRNSHKSGCSIQSLSENYNVTVSTIYRILKNETHVVKDFAKITVIYNPCL